MNIKNEIDKIIDQIQEDAKNKEKKELSLSRVISSLYTLKDSLNIAKHDFDKYPNEDCQTCGFTEYNLKGDCVICDVRMGA